MNTQRRRGFTLIEMLIVIAIIAILAALIFPSFSAAREDARQKTCSSNLREIGLAVQMYRAEEREYPMSLGALLPSSVAPVAPSTFLALPRLDNTAATIFIDDAAAGACDPTTTTCPNVGGTGYLRDVKYLLCPDDGSTSTQPRSSYGDLSTGIPNLAPTDLPSSPEDLSRRTWNFWGYRNANDGVAYNDESAAAAENNVASALPDVVNPLLVNPQFPFAMLGSTSPRANVVKNSLSNRFAPSSTIITYCAYHRPYSSNVSSPEEIYNPVEAANNVGARDLILRVDGTVKSVVVSSWNITDANDPNYRMWQKQTFR